MSQLLHGHRAVDRYAFLSDLVSLYEYLVKRIPMLRGLEVAKLLNPRTDGGPGHLSTDGGADNRPPPEISKTKQARDKR